MKAMILCAGLGTRLRPLTERWPKPALPFLGRPLLRYHLSALKAAGATAVGINTHHLPEVMAAVAADACAREGLPLERVHEPVIQGTGGGIRGLRRLFLEDDFVVLNGDILFPLALREVVERHRASGAAATMVLLAMPESERYAAVELDGRGRVRRIAGRGPGGPGLTPWHFTGVHVLSPRVFDFMSPEGPEDINRDVYVRMIEAGLTVRGDVVQTYWSDLGTPSRYLATLRDVLEGPSALRDLLRVGGDARPLPASAPSWEEDGVERARATIEGPAYLEAGCRLGSGASIGRCVSLGRNVRIGEGARLERVAVFEETVIAPGERLADVIAWGAHRIPAGGLSGGRRDG